MHASEFQRVRPLDDEGQGQERGEGDDERGGHRSEHSLQGGAGAQEEDRRRRGRLPHLPQRERRLLVLEEEPDQRTQLRVEDAVSDAPHGTDEQRSR